MTRQSFSQAATSLAITIGLIGGLYVIGNAIYGEGPADAETKARIDLGVAINICRTVNSLSASDDPAESLYNWLDQVEADEDERSDILRICTAYETGISDHIDADIAEYGELIQ